MTACDDVRAARVLGAPLDAAGAAHAAGCARCGAEAGAVAGLARALAADPHPEPLSGLSARVLTAAAPLLARHAARARRRGLLAAVAAALVPLPVVLALNAALVLGLHHVLSAVLPAALSTWVVVHYAALLALLLAATYGSIPILAERQARRRLEEGHA
jgi:hypothetical protein